MHFKKHFFLLVFILIVLNIKAQQKQSGNITRVLFVFDASKSMKGMYQGKSKMDHAKQIFTSLIDSFSQKKNYEFALRMYGSTVQYPPGDCNDTKLIVPFSKGNVEAIKMKVKAAKPTGMTPIEHSLTLSANDFPDKKAVNTIVLITDGVEECKGDPCVARQKLMEKGIQFKPCIIGIGLSPEQEKTYDCVGKFFSYNENKPIVNEIVNIISTQKLVKTSAQVNLLDLNGKPTETNVNMTFYDEKIALPAYNYVHAINEAGNPDTIWVDESKSYTLVAHTIPPVKKSGILLNAGTHNIIALDAPQGYLKLTREGGIYNYDEKLKTIIKNQSNLKTIHVQPINTSEKYLVNGYSAEVLTLPRTYFSAIEINQSQTKNLTIENAGQLRLKCFEKGDGCIMQEVEGELKWVCNLEDKLEQSFQLQPGNYRITYRAKSVKQSIYSIEKTVSIQSNRQTEIWLTK